MRRENRRRAKENREKIIDKKLIKYTATAVSILAIIVIILLAYSKKLNKNAEEGTLTSKQISNIINNTQEGNTESASTEIGKSVEESKNEISKSDDEKNSNLSNSENKTSNSINNQKTANISNSNSNTNKNLNNKSNTNEKKSSNALKTNKITPIKDLKRSDSQNNNLSENTNSLVGESSQNVQLNFEMPVEGDIVRDFAVDNLIFSETLQEWTTHTGIDIKADKTTVVKSAEAGTVKTIKNDPRYGLTITVEHENGFQSVYANLLSSEFVVEGEKVEKGQALGTVGNSAAFEISDEPHLHFEIIKDSVQVDPRIYLK